MVGDDDQSIYGFRGADIRNILDFERDFPGATVVKLEQNYRSTQTILSAANAVVANNAGRKPKQLWTRPRRGRAGATCASSRTSTRRRASSPRRSSSSADEGIARSEIAVFYRTNAQSRVLEDTLVRFGVSYQVIGGTKFYERAEIKDALAYLTLLVNPQDTVSFSRIVNSPQRGIGQTSQARVVSHANTVGMSVWDVAVDAGGRARASARRRSRRVDAFMSVMERLRELAERTSVGDLLEAVLQETGYVEALEAERTIEAQGRLENLQELVGVAREFDANWEGETGLAGLAEFLQQLSLYSEQDALRDDGRARDPDDAPQRQGPRVPGRVHDRLRGGRLPALALDRRGQPRGGAAALLRRHHPRAAQALHDLRAHAVAVRSALLQHAVAIPRRDARSS